MSLEMPFVGRIAECEALRATLVEGRAGAVVTGDPGMGASRVVAEIAAWATANGRSVATIQALDVLSHVPFGAFAPLLNDSSANHGGEIEAGASALAAVGGAVIQAIGPCPLLVIEDVELLDTMSACLTQQLISGCGARILATAEKGATLPSAIEQLVRDGTLGHVEVGPFDQSDMIALAQSMLGGPFDAVTRRRILAMAQGNPLFLRELLTAGTTSGALTGHGGLWTWTGTVSAADRLGAVLNARLRLDASSQEVLRYVALAEPVGLRLLEQVVPADAIHSAERRRLIVVESNGRRCEVRIAHPIYVEPILADVGPGLRRKLATRLDSAARTMERRRDGDEVQDTWLALEAGSCADADRLDRAATKARELHRLDLAELFGRAALAEGAGIAALNRLAESLIWVSKFDEMLELVDRACFADDDGDELALLELHRSTALFFGLGRLDEAIRATELALTHASTDEIRAVALAHKAEILAFAGMTERAEELSREVLASPAAEPRSRAAAYGAVVPSLAMRGLVGDARTVAEEAYAFAFAEANPPMWEMAGVVAGEFIASLIDPPEALNDAFAPKDDPDPDPLAGIWLCLHGRELLARGDLDAAAGCLTDGGELLAVDDPGRFRPWALATLAAACGMRGDADGAGGAILELGLSPLPSGSVFAADIAIGRAWGMHGAGESAAARSLLLAAFDELAAREAFGLAAMVLLDAMRLGAASGAVRARARCLPKLDCFVVELVKRWDRHRHDDIVLADLANACAERNRFLWAAELAAVAAATTHDLPTQNGYYRLARHWLSECEDARTPLIEPLRHVRSGPQLTPREADVARLVAAGWSNPEVASKLFVARRTVESHLVRIYTKLGINSRDELAAQLGGEPSDHRNGGMAQRRSDRRPQER